MVQTAGYAKKLFVDFYDTDTAVADEFFDEKKIKELFKHSVATVVVVSTVPVRRNTYLTLVRYYESRGFTVLNSFVDLKESQPSNSLSGFYKEVYSALSNGNTLVIFYGMGSAGVLLTGFLMLQRYNAVNASLLVKGLNVKLMSNEHDMHIAKDFERYLNGGSAGSLNLSRLRNTAGNVLIYYGNVLIKTETGLRTVTDALPGKDGTAVKENNVATSAAPLVVDAEENETDEELVSFEDELKDVEGDDDEFEMVLEEPEDGYLKQSIIDFEDEEPAVEPMTVVSAEESVTESETAEDATAAQSTEVALQSQSIETPNAASAPLTLKESEKSAPAGTGRVYTSIRFKLISIISLLIIASLSGMILLATYFFKTDNEVRVQENNHKISEVIALKVGADLQAVMERAGVYARVLLESAGQGKAAEIFRNLIQNEKDLVYLGIIAFQEKSASFKVLSEAYNIPLMKENQLSEDVMKKIMASSEKPLQRGLQGVTAVFNVSPIADLPVMGAAMPYNSGDAGRKMVLVCYLKLDSMLRTFGVSGITKVFLVNDTGDLIAHPDASIVKSGGNLINLPIVKLMMKSTMDNGQTRFPDEKGLFHLGSFKKIGVGGCGVIAMVDEKQAFEEVYNIQRRNIYLMGIVLTIAVLIVFFFGNSLTNPIIQLLGATKKIKEGDYNIDIKPTSRDEIGELTYSFMEMGKGLEEREKMKTAFGKFVNPEIAEMVLKDEIRLGGERKEGVVLFSDIRAFTSISEKMQPEEVVEFLNQYMTRMVECIDKTGGVVDKFIGDAIMAVWGIPVSKGNDVENAINGALLMRKSLVEFNSGRGTDDKPLIHIGCGINVGPLLAGQIGSEHRMEYTVIGDTVNLASRIEALNKPFGTDILISEDAYNMVKDIFRFEKMQPIRVKGKEKPQQIYTVLGRIDDSGSPQTLEHLRKSIDTVFVAEKTGKIDIDKEEVKYEIIGSK